MSDQPGRPDVAGASFSRLVEIMDQLRSPGGCPWDAEQTHASLVKYLVEETYEVVDAIDHGSTDDLIEELGDLLLQVVFHSRIGEEESPSWNIAQVCDGISDKLIRRHPHVFTDLVVARDELDRQWEAQKAAEKQRASVLDGIPNSMPALHLATKVFDRCSKAGLDVQPSSSLPAQVREEIAQSDGAERERVVGDMLSELAYLSYRAGVDPEEALRRSNSALQQRIRDCES